MLVSFKYDIDMDMTNYKNNFLERKFPLYGRENLKIDSFASILNRPNVLDNIEDKEKYVYDNLSKFYSKNKSYFDRQTEILTSEWSVIEPDYISRLEKYMNVKVSFSATCYLTTLGIAPYNVNQKYFYTLMGTSTARQLTTVAHELMHLIFRDNFDDYMLEKGCSRQDILEINEALSVLINYEFFDLFVAPDQNNKPSIQDLRKLVIGLWKDKRDFKYILDELIARRLVK